MLVKFKLTTFDVFFICITYIGVVFASVLKIIETIPIVRDPIFLAIILLLMVIAQPYLLLRFLLKIR